MVDVGHEHGRAVLESHGRCGSLLLGGADGQDGTVVVELAVAGVVDPGPGKQDLVGAGGVGGQGEGDVGVGGAGADLAEDDGEGLTLVVRDGQLTGAAVVGRAAHDLDCVLFAGVPGRNGGSGNGVVHVRDGALAREGGRRVGTRDVRVYLARLDGVGIALIPQRGRVGHVHVTQGSLGRESHEQRYDTRDIHRLGDRRSR